MSDYSRYFTELQANSRSEYKNKNKHVARRLQVHIEQTT